MKPPTILCRSAVLLCLAFLVVPTGSKTSSVLTNKSELPQPSDAVESGSSFASSYVYFVECDGHYTKVDSGTQGIISRGEIWDEPSAARIRPDLSDGCLVGDIQYDYRKGIVYVLFQQPVGGRPDTAKFQAVARFHSEATKLQATGKKYRVAALALPQFNVVSEVKLEGNFESFPTLLLNLEESELLVSYQQSKIAGVKTDEEIAVLARYGVPMLKPLEPVTQVHSISERNPKGPYILSRTAYWDAGRIIDEDTIRDRNGFAIERVDGNELLTDRIKATVESLARLGANNKKYVDVSFADSQAGKMLFVLGSDTRTRPMERGSGLLVYDAINRITLPPIITPFRVSPLDPRTVHLTPDGRFLVLEQYEWQPRCETDKQNCQRIKTGQLTIYDTTGKSPARLVSLPRGSEARVIGFSPHSRLFYYRVSDNVYVINLTTQKEPVLILEVGSPVALFFSTR